MTVKKGGGSKGLIGTSEATEKPSEVPEDLRDSIEGLRGSWESLRGSWEGLRGSDAEAEAELLIFLF